MMMDNGTSGGSGSGDPHHNQGGGGASYDPHGREKKRSHRHTADQIQRLESMFNECPHPDEATRLLLSRELNLTPEQIKFWFQNRRTQMKLQHKRADNCSIQEDNDRIRCENIAIKDAMKNVLCHSCGGPPLGEYDEQKLLMENAQLKEELKRVSSIAAKYLGSQLQPIPMPSPEQPVPMPIPMPTPEQPITMPSIDLDLLHGNSSTSVMNPISGMVKSPMEDVRFKVAGNAMDELMVLFQYNEPLWVKSPVDGSDLLDVRVYDGMLPGPNRLKNPNAWIESSRSSALVRMNSLALVDMFMDVNKWVEVFPNIVSSARTLEVISSGMMGSHSGRLQLMYEELQVLSPFVPPRKLYFLRFCQQIQQSCWAIVDVSVEVPPEYQFSASSPSCQTYRFPSGCLIQELPPSGHSRVIWVEHLEVEPYVGVHILFRDLFQCGMAYGAERWLSTLQRMCDRYYCHDIDGGVHPTPEGARPPPSPEGKRSMMKLTQRLITSFCASINPSDDHQWTTLSGLMNGYDVRATLHGSTHPGHPNVVVLSVATTIWLPIPPQHVFDFLRDASTRPQWDAFSRQNPVEEVVHIATGSNNFGNYISVLRGIDTSKNSDMLILQESCVDSSGSMVVYGAVDITSISLALSGADPSNIYLLPSGFAILPDGCIWKTGSGQGASSSSGGIGGSLLTLVIQICVGSLPSATMSPEMETTARNLIGSTMDHIKAAFNCSTTTSP